jgi:hypothetical protein
MVVLLRMVVMLRLEGSRHTEIFAWTLGVSVEQDQAGYAHCSLAGGHRRPIGKPPLYTASASSEHGAEGC